MKSMEEIREALGRHRPEDVAAATGLSYGTVRRYAAGIPIRPALDTVQRLSDWLERHEVAARAVE